MRDDEGVRLGARAGRMRQVRDVSSYRTLLGALQLPGEQVFHWDM